MEIQIVNKDLHIHNTPLEEMLVTSNKIIVMFDDCEDNRWRVTICPYQAIKITTIDCVDTHPLLINGSRPFNILAFKQSEWINSLQKVLLKKDSTTDFMQKSRHFIFPFQDNILEVVAWDNLQIEMI